MAQNELIDTTSWPVVRVRIPETIPDDAGPAYVQEMQAILDRREHYAVIFEGPERPDSPEFNRHYMKWYKSTKALQKELCCGVVRIEADDGKRNRAISKAMTYLAKAAIPYPYEVCGSEAEAEAIAKRMLASRAETN